MNAENRLFGEVLRQTDALLIPDPGKIVRAKERARRLAEALDRSDAAMFRVVRCHDHGSTSRGTCIDGFQDLDLLVELDPATLRTGSGSERTPSDTISRMARALEARRRGPVSLGLVKIRAQDHSVGVEYAGQEGFRVDLVPAIDAGAGRLKIPERGSGRWIVTSPGETKQRVERAIRRSPEVISAIRLLKGWKRARGRNAPIPSFGVETMVVDAALAGSAALEGLVRDFFHTIAGSDARMRLVLGGTSARGAPVTLVDPVSMANLTDELSQDHGQTLVRTCRSAAEALATIYALCSRGESSRARTAARNLFVGKGRA